MLDINSINLTLSGLKKHYLDDDFSPLELIKALLFANQEYNQHNPIWIHLLSETEAQPYIYALHDKNPNILPLFGVPFAIKDNIDLAGIATTAACPDFSYTAKSNAFVVEQLIKAGAIPLGKTNLDQFATGLVGVRSPEPWGPCHNALNENYISGGSSAGSAVAVAKGLVSFSLGTDTAGSGRVPASLNNIVGLKPSRGLLSARGVVPACRSLDCVSVFALTSADANTVFDVASVFDAQDAYARPNPYENSQRYFNPDITKGNNVVIGVPAPEQLEFFGNSEAQQLFSHSLSILKKSGVKLVEIDFSPFTKAAKLLYEGPWVAERYLATQSLIESSPQSLLPVIHTIINKGKESSALDAFAAQYKLQAFQQLALQQLASVDAIATPTQGTAYTVAEVQNDPIQLNSNLGYYTNFMNLLDCAAVSLPTGFYQNGVGFGITLFHNAMSDKRLLSISAALQRITQLPLGATPLSTDSSSPCATQQPKSHINVVVCGAHLDGLPLNWQLKERGATLLQKTTSSPHYKLYALAGGPPFRPGMVRVAEGGNSIEVEVWRIPVQHFGSFVAEIPAPLGIGKVELADGHWECGFICESFGIEGATDITQLGGWRQYIKH